MNRRQKSPRRAASHSAASVLLALGIVAGLCYSSPLAHAADECTEGLNVGLPQPEKPVVPVQGEPIYEAIGQGKSPDPINDIGLCGAFRGGASTSSFVENIPSRPYAAPNSINDFMNDRMGMPRVDQNLTTPFDLSNNINDMGENSWGDYVSTPECRPPGSMDTQWPGCSFPGSLGANLRLGFGTRFRGFIDVKSDWVNKPLHFGFYVDDILGAAIISRKPDTKPIDAAFVVDWVISRGAAIGKQKWISTNQVVFAKPGVYAIEILHGSYSGAAVLEFAILMQDNYVDREHGPLDIVRVPLDAPACRFNITRTNPTRLYQSVCGRFHYDTNDPNLMNVAACEQCNKINNVSFRGVPRRRPDMKYPTEYPCPDKRWCNGAEICSPCVEDIACGPSCRTCVGDKPRCKTDPDDPCNADKADCCQCVSNKDCAAGQICDGCNCVSPPCCPGSFAVFPDKARDPNFRLCSPCLSDTDCQMKGLGQICDLKNARCTNTAPPACLKDGLSPDEQCGPACNINCRTHSPERPYCLNNMVCVACRRDADCPSGNFCLSGTCSNPCVDDRHCGPSCQNCGIAVSMDPQNPVAEGKPTNKPYCKVDVIDGQKVVATGLCVQCREDKECAQGQTCVDNRCTPDQPCSQACPSNEVCFGGKCVQCFTDAQCPCGHCIEGRCSDKCTTNQDCEGNQCCQKSTGLCVSGRCGGTAGGALCGCSMPGVAASSLLSTEPDVLEPFEPSQPAAGKASRSIGLSAIAALLLGLALRRRMRTSTRWS